MSVPFTPGSLLAVADTPSYDVIAGPYFVNTEHFPPTITTITSIPRSKRAPDVGDVVAYGPVIHDVHSSRSFIWAAKVLADDDETVDERLFSHWSNGLFDFGHYLLCLDSLRSITSMQFSNAVNAAYVISGSSVTLQGFVHGRAVFSVDDHVLPHGDALIETSVGSLGDDGGVSVLPLPQDHTIDKLGIPNVVVLPLPDGSDGLLLGTSVYTGAELVLTYTFDSVPAWVYSREGSSRQAFCRYGSRVFSSFAPDGCIYELVIKDKTCVLYNHLEWCPPVVMSVCNGLGLVLQCDGSGVPGHLLVYRPDDDEGTFIVLDSLYAQQLQTLDETRTDIIAADPIELKDSSKCARYMTYRPGLGLVLWLAHPCVSPSQCILLSDDDCCKLPSVSVSSCYNKEEAKRDSIFTEYLPSDPKVFFEDVKLTQYRSTRHYVPCGFINHYLRHRWRYQAGILENMNEQERSVVLHGGRGAESNCDVANYRIVAGYNCSQLTGVLSPSYVNLKSLGELADYLGAPIVFMRSCMTVPCIDIGTLCDVCRGKRSSNAVHVHRTTHYGLEVEPMTLGPNDVCWLGVLDGGGSDTCYGQVPELSSASFDVSDGLLYFGDVAEEGKMSTELCVSNGSWRTAACTDSSHVAQLAVYLDGHKPADDVIWSFIDGVDAVGPWSLVGEIGVESSLFGCFTSNRERVVDRYFAGSGWGKYDADVNNYAENPWQYLFLRLAENKKHIDVLSTCVGSVCTSGWAQGRFPLMVIREPNLEDPEDSQMITAIKVVFIW